jgi:hypothetical protein
MVDESVDQLKKQRAIEHIELALADLQRYQSSPIIMNSMVQIHDAMVLEYNELYIPVAEEGGEIPKAYGGKKGEGKGKEDTQKL